MRRGFHERKMGVKVSLAHFHDLFKRVDLGKVVFKFGPQLTLDIGIIADDVFQVRCLV